MKAMNSVDENILGFRLGLTTGLVLFPRLFLPRKRSFQRPCLFHSELDRMNRRIITSREVQIVHTRGETCRFQIEDISCEGLIVSEIVIGI